MRQSSETGYNRDLPLRIETWRRFSAFSVSITREKRHPTQFRSGLPARLRFQTSLLVTGPQIRWDLREQRRAVHLRDA